MSWRQQVSQIRQARFTEPEDDLDEFQRFARANLFIRNTSKQLVPFVLRPVQLELHRDLTGRDIISKARKHGISTYFAARYYWKITTGKNAGAAMVAHKPDATDKLWKIVQLFYRHDPRVLSGELRALYSSKKELVFGSLNSSFEVLQAGMGSGRGGTLNYLHISEFGWWSGDAEAILLGMIESVPPPELGTEIAIESTSHGEGNAYHLRFKDSVKHRSEFQAHFFPWYEHPENVRPWFASQPAYSEEEVALAARHNLTREQIAFRRWKIGEIGPRPFKQEHPETWEESFLSAGHTIFDADALLQEEKVGVRPPLSEVKDSNGYVRVHERPRNGRKYIAGVDVAQGIADGDAQDVSILDAATLHEVATMNGRWPLHVFARKSAALLNAYKAFVGCERNNHGHAILEHWLNGRDEMRVPDERIYHRSDYDARGQKIRVPGWDTNNKSRPIMIAHLEEFTRKRMVTFRDSETYQELRAFAVQENGKAEAPVGEFDDRVMSRAIALQMRDEALLEVGWVS